MRQGSPVRCRRCPRNCKRRVRGNGPLARVKARPGRRRGRRPRARRPPHRRSRVDSSGGGGALSPSRAPCALPPLTLVLGGARSGKSRYAEGLVEAAAAAGTYCATVAALAASLREAAGPVVLVANEVGMGLVPETALGRRFRDAAGRLNQQMAALAQRVVFVAAGLPLVLKEEG